MTEALDASVFSGTDRYLRVWFSTSAGGPFTQLGDQRISSVPFALQAQEAANADTLDGSHASDFAQAAHTHDDLYYRESELNTSGGGGQVHWDNLTGVPAGFADGVDDTGAVGPHDHWGESWSGSGTGLSLSGGSIGLDARGTTRGVYGRSSSTSGRGVYGKATATSGYTYGVYGESDSTDHGRGVYGTAPKYGVHGYATADSGHTYGVYGESRSTSGTGVSGRATADSGTGVYGCSGTWCIWVSGSYGMQGYSSTGYGVYGMSYSGRGVYGYASATSGTTYGVYGESESSDGYGGYFRGKAGSLVLTGAGDPPDDGTIHSHPDEPDSDLVFYSNDFVVIHLDDDDEDERNSEFLILNGDDTKVFEVNENGAFLHRKIQSTQDSYVHVPGTLAVLHESDRNKAILKYWGRGTVQIDDPTEADINVLFPVVLSGVLYGQPVRVEEVTVFYQTSNSRSYIDTTRVFRQKSDGEYYTLVNNTTNRTSTTFTRYNVFPNADNVLSADEGFLMVSLVLHFGNLGDSITIGGVRVRLGHTE
jgi:hypothetical protein